MCPYYTHEYAGCAHITPVGMLVVPIIHPWVRVGEPYIHPWVRWESPICTLVYTPGYTPPVYHILPGTPRAHPSSGPVMPRRAAVRGGGKRRPWAQPC